MTFHYKRTAALLVFLALPLPSDRAAGQEGQADREAFDTAKRITRLGESARAEEAWLAYLGLDEIAVSDRLTEAEALDIAARKSRVDEALFWLGHCRESQKNQLEAAFHTYWVLSRAFPGSHWSDDAQSRGISLAESLCRRGGETGEYETFLLETAAEGHPSVSEQACLALGRLANRRALPGLAELLKSDDPYLRRQAVEALVLAPGDVVDKLLDSARSDKDSRVREAAAGAIAERDLRRALGIDPLYPNPLPFRVQLGRYADRERRPVLTVGLLLPADQLKFQVRRTQAAANGGTYPVTRMAGKARESTSLYFRRPPNPPAAGASRSEDTAMVEGRVRLYDGGRKQVYDRSEVFEMTRAELGRKTEYLLGLPDVPVEPGEYHLVVEANDLLSGRKGLSIRAVRLDRLEPGKLSTSTFYFWQTGRVLISGEERTPVIGMERLLTGDDPLTVSFQVYGLKTKSRDRNVLKVEYKLFLKEITGSGQATSPIWMEYKGAGPASASITGKGEMADVDSDLDLSRLPSGEWMLSVSIQDLTGGGSLERHFEFVKL